MLAVTAELSGLDPADRITPILEAMTGMPQCGELRVETADTT